MKSAIGIVALVILPHSLASSADAQSGPYDGKTFHGRIAYSADGNYNDEDDWAASPVALAIFAHFGVKEKLVHFDYNSILPRTDPEWEKTHETSVLGAVERYGYRKAVFHDCRKDLDGAVDSITKADPEKRKFVYVISHSRWNDGFNRYDWFTHTKRDVIPLGIHWIQITDQNRFLSTSPFGRAATPAEWEPWHWMRDSDDAKLRFLWERLRATTRADCRRRNGLLSHDG